MWRGIAASIVTAGMLTGAAFAQVEAPPATPAPPAAADPDARARERELRDRNGYEASPRDASDLSSWEAEAIWPEE